LSLNGTAPRNSGAHCCWEKPSDTANSLKPIVSGIHRTLKYIKDITKTGDLVVGDTMSMHEGVLKKGVNDGLTRIISGKKIENWSFIGQMKGEKASFKGLFFKDLSFKYMGLYDNTRSYWKEPSFKYKFYDFGPEKVDRTKYKWEDAIKEDIYW